MIVFKMAEKCTFLIIVFKCNDFCALHGVQRHYPHSYLGYIMTALASFRIHFRDQPLNPN